MESNWIWNSLCFYGVSIPYGILFGFHGIAKTGLIRYSAAKIPFEAGKILV
jgi:hypothetical protein